MKEQLDQKEAFLQYKRRCQNGLDWIADRKQRIENENMDNNDLAKGSKDFRKSGTELLGYSVNQKVNWWP